jgi:hypothetical protein
MFSVEANLEDANAKYCKSITSHHIQKNCYLRTSNFFLLHHRLVKAHQISRNSAISQYINAKIKVRSQVPVRCVIYTNSILSVNGSHPSLFTLFENNKLPRQQLTN